MKISYLDYIQVLIRDYYSCADKEEQSPRLRADTHKVQGPMPPIPLHARAQGLGQSREAEAESSTRLVIRSSSGIGEKQD